MVPRPVREEQAPGRPAGAAVLPAAGPTARTGHRPGDDHELADEHAVLLHEVRNRERAVHAGLGAGHWPQVEVESLVRYLRYEVLDQAVTEERLLFPLTGGGAADDRLRQLVIDHVRLRDLTDALADTATAVAPLRQPDRLLGTLDALVPLLDGHMRREQTLLSEATVAGVESLRRPFRCHSWFPLVEGGDVDLDVLPPEFAHRAAMERLGRMRPGEGVRLTASHELDGVWAALAGRLPGEYGWMYLEEGPERWQADITRRAPE
jgi:uncharacterized protein (DUF2249 family)